MLFKNGQKLDSRHDVKENLFEEYKFFVKETHNLRGFRPRKQKKRVKTRKGLRQEPRRRRRRRRSLIFYLSPTQKHTLLINT